MTRSKQHFQEKKTKEATNALTAILKSLAAGTGVVLRFFLWPIKNGIRISLDIGYDEAETTSEEDS